MLRITPHIFQNKASNPTHSKNADMLTTPFLLPMLYSLKLIYQLNIQLGR